MNRYEPALYRSPINLPERRHGRIEIRHRTIPMGEEVAVIGHRQAILRGTPYTKAVLKQPLRIHQLIEHRHRGEALWMTDLPEELNQIGEMLHTVQPQGRVLVGGLGLGIVASMAARLDDVTDVTVVERSSGVIALTAQHDQYNVRQESIKRYLEETKKGFDFYLLDTWAGTNETTWWTEVMPLRRAIRQRHGIGPEIHCWAEDMMWAQLYNALTNPLTRPHWYYSYLPVPMSRNDAAAFLNMVGTTWWEKEYGKAVDKYVNEVEDRVMTRVSKRRRTA